MTINSPEKTRTPRIALIGSPNAGKTTIFNALTGLRAKTGNYPGITVSKYEGTAKLAHGDATIEDLPGTYSLSAISPDEQIVVDTIKRENTTDAAPDALLVVLDATTLTRSLHLLASTFNCGRPVAVALTFSDELQRRGGAIDSHALSQALGIPVVAVTSGRRADLDPLKELLGNHVEWTRPAITPPTDPEELASWSASILQRASYTPPSLDERSERIDKILLHPVLGTAIFFAVMWLFFQTIFTVAAPVQDIFEGFFVDLGATVATNISNPWLSSFIGDALIGGLGGVAVFLPQIALLFFLLAILEGSGYMARAAFLMDRVMSSAGLEGRAFVAMLSSVACAIPGIMATRTLPSSKDRIATMMAAPLMTCSARLPVYVLLIGLLVDSDAKIGPFGAQGTVMFGLYVLGAVSTMAAAWVFSRITSRSESSVPFYIEMPGYQAPKIRPVLLAVVDAAKLFIKRVTTIILATTIVLWILLNAPFHSDSALREAGVDPTDSAAAASYSTEHSYAASIGKTIQPVFEPLGFEWRISVGLISAQAAREVFVATLGQVAAAEDPEDPASSLQELTVTHGPRTGEPVFTPPVIASLLVFFVYSLQCMSTVGVLRRETNSWKWPGVAFGYMFVLAWVGGFLAYNITQAVM